MILDNSFSANSILTLKHVIRDLIKVSDAEDVNINFLSK